MLYKIRILVLLLFCLCICIDDVLHAQNLNVLTELVGEKNKKSVEKAIDNIADAGKLTQEANDYYNEALALQSNYELDEKTLQKKLSSVESKAIATQIKADKIYAAAYKSIYELCIDRLNEASISYGESSTYQSEATQMMTQASEKRNNAGDASNVYEKATLLNEASGLEGAAIDNLIIALQLQQGITPPSLQEESYDYHEEKEPEYTPPTSYSVSDYPSSVEQKSEDLAIDQNVVGKYETYINDPTIPEPVTVTRAGVSGVSEISVDAARSVLHGEGSYREEPEVAESQYQTPDQQMIIQDTLTTLVEYDNQQEETEEETATETAPYEQPVTKPTVYPELGTVPQYKDVVFAVQVAASRIPLTRSQTWAIYSGNTTVEVIEENGWYKYRLTGFRLFSEANRVALESGVRDAFVIAYSEGKQIDLPQAREMTRVAETDVKRYGRKSMPNETDYFVQVAASRIRMDENSLGQLCGDVNRCREVIEEGWFKYQIYAGNDYNEARELKSKMRPDAFVVAYIRGAKVKLYDAINKN
jgi:hypothetical protein